MPRDILPLMVGAAAAAIAIAVNVAIASLVHPPDWMRALMGAALIWSLLMPARRMGE